MNTRNIDSDRDSNISAASSNISVAGSSSAAGNNNNNNNDNQQQNLGSPFMALTIVDGKIALTGSEGQATTAGNTSSSPSASASASASPSASASASASASSRSSCSAATSAPVAAPKAVLRRAIAMPDRRRTLKVNATAADQITSVAEAAPLTGWDLLSAHKKNGRAIRGQVIRVIHSHSDKTSIVGVKVRLAGLDGFVPFRMLGLSPLEAEQSVTLEMGFRVVELEKGTAEKGSKDRIILNRQVVATEEKSAILLKSVKIGDTVSGTVRNIKPFGAFVDIDGASALIHVNDLPQGNVRSVKIGQQVTAKVVKIDSGKNQLGISIKHQFISQLVPGTEFAGLVKNVEPFGVFVELGETVDGLVHVSRLGEANPARGDIARVKILSINNERGQVQLALVGIE